jgi:signal transduction histidine kinase
MLQSQIQSPKRSPAPPTWPYWLTVVGAGVVVVVGIVFYSVLWPGLTSDSSVSDRLTDYAQAGDSMAPLVGLVSALALFAAVGSIWLQRKELSLQRQELAETRKVMDEQRQELARSAKAQQELIRAQKEVAKLQKEANTMAGQANDLGHEANRAQANANKVAALQARLSANIVMLGPARMDTVAKSRNPKGQPLQEAAEDLDQLTLLLAAMAGDEGAPGHLVT